MDEIKPNSNKEEIKAACMELFLRNGKDRGEVVLSCDDMPYYDLLRGTDHIEDIKKRENYFEFALTEKAIALLNEPTN